MYSAYFPEVPHLCCICLYLQAEAKGVIHMAELKCCHLSSGATTPQGMCTIYTTFWYSRHRRPLCFGSGSATAADWKPNKQHCGKFSRLSQLMCIQSSISSSFSHFYFNKEASECYKFLQTKNRQINLHNFSRLSLKESNTEDKEPQHRILSALPRSLMKPHVTSWHRWLMSMVMWGAELTSPAWNVVKSTFAGRFKHRHVKSKVTWRQKLLLYQHFPHD